MADSMETQRDREREARGSGASAPIPGGEAAGRDSAGASAPIPGGEAAGRDSAAAVDGAAAVAAEASAGGEAAARDRGEVAFDDAEAPEASARPEEADALTEAQQQAGEYLALAQRTQADFENYRKRMARENALASARGVGRLAKELLPALDHFELALRSVQADDETRKGFTLVRDEIVNALRKVGIEPFSPQGEVFDPVEHEAMAQHPVDGAVSGTVVEVYQQGYRLDGSVLRPARVIVAA
jgi:molecular chaperone GrpE